MKIRILLLLLLLFFHFGISVGLAQMLDVQKQLIKDIQSPKKWESIASLFALDRLQHTLLDGQANRKQSPKINFSGPNQKLLNDLQTWLTFQHALSKDQTDILIQNQLGFADTAYLLMGQHIHIRDAFLENPWFPLSNPTTVWTPALAGDQQKISLLFYFENPQNQAIQIKFAHQGKVSGFIDDHFLGDFPLKSHAFLDQTIFEIDLPKGTHRLLLNLEGISTEVLWRFESKIPLKSMLKPTVDGQYPNLSALESIYQTQARQAEQLNQKSNPELKISNALDMVKAELAKSNQTWTTKELLGIATFVRKQGFFEQDLNLLMVKIDEQWQQRPSLDLIEAILLLNQSHKIQILQDYPISAIPTPSPLEKGRSDYQWAHIMQSIASEHLQYARFQDCRDLLDLIAQKGLRLYALETELALLHELNLKEQARILLYDFLSNTKTPFAFKIYLQKLYFKQLLAQGLTQEAVDLYHILLSNQDVDFEMNYQIYSAWTKINLKEGVDRLKTVISNHPRTWLIYDELGEIAYQTRDWQTLFELKYPIFDSANLLLLKAKASILVGDFENAKNILVNLLTASSDNENARLLLEEFKEKQPQPLEPSFEMLQSLKQQAQPWFQSQIDQNHSAIYLLDQKQMGIDEKGRHYQRVRQWIEITKTLDQHPLSIKQIVYHPTRETLKLIKAKRYRQNQYAHAYTFEQSEISDPDSRMFYDLVAKVIDFNQLSKGDLIEIEYEIHQNTPNPTLSAHISELLLWADLFPKLYVSYQVDGKTSQSTHAQNHLFDQIKIQEKSNLDGSKEWIALQVDPYRLEEDQPSPKIAYLVISTINEWAEFAKQYASILSPLVEPSEQIKSLAETWTQGIDDGPRGIEEKIRVLFNQVTRHIRYVGLEFGNHSFEPAKPEEVWKRGFGDCKDRSTLMIALAKSIGIDLKFVMIRTQPHSQLDPNQRLAGLYFFNHAIVYSPDLKRYLDPTTIYEDALILPSADRYGDVLVLDLQNPQNAKLQRLNLLDEQIQGYAIDLKENLAASKPDMLALHIQFTGTNASHVRRRFQESHAQASFLSQYNLPTEIESLKFTDQILNLGFEESFDHTEALAAEDENFDPISLKRDPLLMWIDIQEKQIDDLFFWLKKLRFLIQYAPDLPRQTEWYQKAIQLRYRFDLPCHHMALQRQFQKQPNLSKYFDSANDLNHLQHQSEWAYMHINFQKTEEQCIFSFKFELKTAIMSAKQAESFRDELHTMQQKLNSIF